MTTIRTSATVNPDGKIVVPVGTDEAGKQVIVTITPVSAPMTQAEWQAFIDRTAGSIPDLERPPQGEYETREPQE